MLLFDIAAGALALLVWCVCLVGPAVVMVVRRRISAAGIAVWLCAAILAGSWLVVSVRLADQTDGAHEPMTDWRIWVGLTLALSAAATALLPRRPGWSVHLL